MKTCIFAVLILFASFLIPSSAARAQSSEPYVPPPMFDPAPNGAKTTAPGTVSTAPKNTPAQTPQKSQQPAAVVKPRLMQPIIDSRDLKAGKSKAVSQTKESVAKPQPPKKPVAPQVNAPAVPNVEAAAPVPMPVKPQAVESTIKGPQTMPALPAVKVHSEQTFDEKSAAPPQSGAEPTILQRQQMKAQEVQKKTPPMPQLPPANVKPASFDAAESAKADQKVLKKIIPFQAGQIALSAEDLGAIAAGVNEQMKEDDKFKVEIRSYATAFGNGLSSDRRIALSRALSLRTSLIGYGVPASKINVLAEGLETVANQPGDRIDLYLYAPKND